MEILYPESNIYNYIIEQSMKLEYSPKLGREIRTSGIVLNYKEAYDLCLEDHDDLSEPDRSTIMGLVELMTSIPSLDDENSNKLKAEKLRHSLSELSASLKDVSNCHLHVVKKYQAIDLGFKLCGTRIYLRIPYFEIFNVIHSAD